MFASLSRSRNLNEGFSITYRRPESLGGRGGEDRQRSKSVSRVACRTTCPKFRILEFRT